MEFRGYQLSIIHITNVSSNGEHYGEYTQLKNILNILVRFSSGHPSDEPRAAACLVRIRGTEKDLADVIMGNLSPGADDSFNLSPVLVNASKLNAMIGAPETKLEVRSVLYWFFIVVSSFFGLERKFLKNKDTGLVK